jgi:hypothetical protein
VALLEWALNNWYWALGGYAVAFGVCVALGARSYVRTERAKLAVADSQRNLGRAVARSDGDSHRDRTALRTGLRDAERESIWGLSGRHCADSAVPDGDPVRTDAQAVTL